jgi:hypothetical protein
MEPDESGLFFRAIIRHGFRDKMIRDRLPYSDGEGREPSLVKKETILDNVNCLERIKNGGFSSHLPDYKRDECKIPSCASRHFKHFPGGKDASGNRGI